MLNDSIEELMRKAGDCQDPAVQELLGRLEDLDIDELLRNAEELEEVKAEVDELRNEQASWDTKEGSLQKRIEACGGLLDTFRRRLDIDERRTGISFGDEYDWSEVENEDWGKYAPDFDNIHAAFRLLGDGEVEEFWITCNTPLFQNGRLYERIY